MDKEYQIGDVANWKVGNIICKGIVREDLGDSLSVRVVEINGRTASDKVTVKKSLCISKE